MKKNYMQIWYESINGIFDLRGIPERYRWREEKDVARVLNVVGKQSVSSVCFPDGERAIFSGISTADGIELILEKEAKRVTEKISTVEKRVLKYLLPGCLHLGSFEGDRGAFTYLRLETNKGPYAFFAINSPLQRFNIVPMNYMVNESVDDFRSFIDGLRKNY